MTSQIIVGALGEGMLRLAGELADGVLLNYLPATPPPAPPPEPTSLIMPNT
jgi:hypothetical protein